MVHRRDEVLLDGPRVALGGQPPGDHPQVVAGVGQVGSAGTGAIVGERTGALPNIDLASAAVLHAVGLPAESGQAIFQIGRSVGVAAHVVEEYAEEPLRWRGRKSQG